MVISVGNKYRITRDGETLIARTVDAAWNTDSRVLGFLCENVEDASDRVVFFPDEFVTEVL